MGSGKKTVVAGLAMFAAVIIGRAAPMVPTEILAEQHFESLESLSRLETRSLDRTLKAAEKREVSLEVPRVRLIWIIGTHAFSLWYKMGRLIMLVPWFDYQWWAAPFFSQRRIYGKKWTTRRSHDDGDAHSTNPLSQPWRMDFHWSTKQSRAESL